MTNKTTNKNRKPKSNPFRSSEWAKKPTNIDKLFDGSDAHLLEQCVCGKYYFGYQVPNPQCDESL